MAGLSLTIAVLVVGGIVSLAAGFGAVELNARLVAGSHGYYWGPKRAMGMQYLRILTFLWEAAIAAFAVGFIAAAILLATVSMAESLYFLMGPGIPMVLSMVFVHLWLRRCYRRGRRFSLGNDKDSEKE